MSNERTWEDWFDDNVFKCTVVVLLGIGFLWTVGACAPYVIFSLAKWLNAESSLGVDFAKSAQIGDAFGLANSVMSGAALGGAIFAILLQIRELRIQRREYQESQNIWKQQARQADLSSYINTLNTIIGAENISPEVRNEARHLVRSLFADIKDTDVIRSHSNDNFKKRYVPNEIADHNLRIGEQITGLALLSETFVTQSMESVLEELETRIDAIHASSVEIQVLFRLCITCPALEIVLPQFEQFLAEVDQTRRLVRTANTGLVNDQVSSIVKNTKQRLVSAGEKIATEMRYFREQYLQQCDPQANEP